MQGKDGDWRTFQAGQQFSVYLELEAAEPGGNVNTDIFQVHTGTLRAASPVQQSIEL